MVDSPRRLNPNASKPRHVPAFREVSDVASINYLASLCSSEDLELILRFYSCGMIGLVRVQKDDDHVEGFISDVCKRCTRLTIDKAGTSAQPPVKRSLEGQPVSDDSEDGYWTASIGFTNRSKRWTLCPSRVCCSSAVDRDKVVGQWKILQLDSKGESLVVPHSVRESYDVIMDDADYFVSTLCPQQTYHAKHLPQGSNVVFDRLWHYNRRYRYPLDILVFVDDDLFTRVVWVMKQCEGMEKYEGKAEMAEEKLMALMTRVMAQIRESNVNGGNKDKPLLGKLDSITEELHSRIF